MGREAMVVGGCTFRGWRYATWPLVSAGVEDQGFRVGARLWPILRFGFFDADRSLIEFSRESRSVLIPWTSVRGVELRRPNSLSLTMLDGWKLGFDTLSEPLSWLVEEARAYVPGSSHGSRDA